MKKDSILEDIVNGFTINRYATDYELTSLISVIILARFMVDINDKVEIKHIKTIINELKKNKTQFFDNKHNRKFKIYCDKLPIIKISKIENKIRNIILFINENIELNKILNKLNTNNDANSIINILKRGTNIDIDINLKFHTTERLSYIITGKKYANHALTIGLKDLAFDYGYSKQSNFLTKMFLIDINSLQTLDNYKKIVQNDSVITSESIFKASKYLFNEYSTLLNKMLFFDNNIKENIYNVFNNTIVKDNTCSNSMIIKYDNEFHCEELNHSNLKFMLKHEDISINVAKCKTPIIEISSNNMKILQIRMRRELYEKSLTGNRYKLYIEPKIK